MGVPRKECSAVKIWGMITPSAPSQTRTPQESMLSALWEHEKKHLVQGRIIERS